MQGAAAVITLTGNINSHDPAGPIKDGGTYYHFTTGTGVWYSYSTNLTQWTPGPATVFPPRELKLRLRADKKPDDVWFAVQWGREKG